MSENGHPTAAGLDNWPTVQWIVMVVRYVVMLLYSCIEGRTAEDAAFSTMAFKGKTADFGGAAGLRLTATKLSEGTATFGVATILSCRR